MRFSFAAIFTGLVALVAAAPQGRPSRPGGPNPPSTSLCLTTTTAGNLVSGFASLLTAYSNATADALLASDFTDTSSSINALIGIDTNAVTFPSKDAFKAGQGTQPPIPFTVLSIDAITCTNITFRWSTTVTPVGAVVKGINSLVASNLNNTAAGWQIKTVYR